MTRPPFRQNLGVAYVGRARGTKFPKTRLPSVYQGPGPAIASVMSGTRLPGAASPIWTGYVPEAKPPTLIVGVSVRFPGRKPFIVIPVSVTSEPIFTSKRRSKYIGAFLTFDQLRFRVKEE